MSYISPADRHQYTMINSLDDLLPSEHPVRLLDQVIDLIVSNNPERFGEERIGEVGRPEYSPGTLLKLYLYGYCNGIRSSRRLEMESRRNIEVMWLLGTLSPDHWTISAYRKDHGDDIKYVTKKFREFLHDTGYIKGDCVAIDGSKIKANAKLDALTKEKIEKRLERVDEELEKYLGLLAENDQRENLLEELDTMEDISGREAALINKIVTLQQQVEALTKQKVQLKESGQTSINSTDPEAHLMKSREGIIPAYNVQIVVDAENKLIADSEVLTNPDDHNLLPMMVASLVEEIGKAPEEVLADKGYYTPDLVERVEKEHSCICYVPYPEKKINSVKEITFQYDHFTDSYICSEGKPLPLLLKNKHQHKSRADVYRGAHCLDCRLRQVCTTSRLGRQLYRYNNQVWRDRYKERLKQPLNQIKLAMRKSIVEHPFGTIKWLGGKIPLLLRGLKNTTTEINLYTTAYNLKRLFNIESFQTLTAIFSTYQWRTP